MTEWPLQDANNRFSAVVDAAEHGLAVVTRNVRHFEPTGVPVLDPSTLRSTQRSALDNVRIPPKT